MQRKLVIATNSLMLSGTVMMLLGIAGADWMAVAGFIIFSSAIVPIFAQLFVR